MKWVDFLASCLRFINKWSYTIYNTIYLAKFCFSDEVGLNWKAAKDGCRWTRWWWWLYTDGGWSSRCVVVGLVLVALKWHRWSWRRGVMVHWRPGSSRRPSPKDSLSIDPSSPTSHTLHTLDPHQDYYYSIVKKNCLLFDQSTICTPWIPINLSDIFHDTLCPLNIPKFYFLSIVEWLPVCNGSIARC